MAMVDVTFRISESKLSVLFGAVSGYGELVSVLPVSVPPAKAGRPHRPPSYDLKVSETSLGKVAMQWIRTQSGDIEVLKLGPVLASNGFSASSASPVVSGLIREGKVVRIKRGIVRAA